MRRVVAIVNPGARAGRGCQRWRDAVAGFTDRSLEWVTVESRSREHVRDLAAHAEADVVAAVGGDGTINAVLNGLLSRGPEAPPLAVIYAGTSPDFCRFHGLPTDLPSAVRTVATGTVVRRDVARIEYGDEGGGRRHAFFGCSANLGIGPIVATRANRWRPWLGDHAGTGLAVLSALGRRHADLCLTLDAGDPIRLPRCCHLCIAKSPWIASGLRFTGDLGPADGRLAVLAISRRSWFGLLGLLPAFYSGTVSTRPGVLFRNARRAVVIGAGAVEFDGDPQGVLPVAVEVQPGALRLLVPEVS